MALVLRMRGFTNEYLNRCHGTPMLIEIRPKELIWGNGEIGVKMHNFVSQGKH